MGLEVDAVLYFALHSRASAPSKQKNAPKSAFFLLICKFFTTFVVDSYAGGSMSREKRFVMVLLRVGFGNIALIFKTQTIMRKLFSTLSSTLQEGVRGGLLFLALVASVSVIHASDISVDSIWYNFNDNSKTATVTYRGDSYWSYSSEYSGSIVIPETVIYSGTTYSVTSIENSAFYNCSSLTSVTIPNSVTSIGERAFYACSSLTSVIIPNSVTSIESSAFFYCSSLTSVTIGNRVTSIGSSAFSNCHSLTKTNYTGDIAGWCDIKFGNSSANPIDYSYNFYINDVEIKDLVIPNSVDSIHKDAFYNCSSLTSVTIPNSVTSIGNHAFHGCSSLTSVTIPNSVTSIGNSAFNNCSSLTSVTIPNSVTSIGNHAFRQCSSLTSLTIGNSVTSIGSDAFKYCSSLTSLTIGNSVTSIGSSIFEGCNNITSVIWNAKKCNRYNFGSQVTSFEFGNKVEIIPDSLCKGMEKLTSVTVPNSVKTIGTSAFEGCIRLGKISLGTGLEEIAANAFAECKRLYDIYTYATYPPFVDESSFANYNAYLYVPCDSKRDYTLDPVWGKFQNIECLNDEPTDIENIETPLQSPTNVQKLFRNGQLIIVRDGVEYNAMGVEM